MNKEVEEAMKRLRECVRNSDDEYATVIIQQAFSDMEEEIHQMKIQHGYTIAEWGVSYQELEEELQVAKDRIEELENKYETEGYDESRY